MAELVTVEGQEYKKRHPWGVYGLALLTLGVYYFVWYYKINDEARRYLRDESIKPILAMLALFVPIVNWISIYNTGGRIVRMEEKAGAPTRLEPFLAVGLALLAVIFPLVALHIPYMQTHLNDLWDAAAAPAGQAEAPGAAAG